ncbi:protein maintenance of PSII under high light 1 [Tanacetum coccineum]
MHQLAVVKRYSSDVVVAASIVTTDFARLFESGKVRDVEFAGNKKVKVDYFNDEGVEDETSDKTYSLRVQPAVYVEESALSSGTSGTSTERSEYTATLFPFGALIAVASASTILLQVGKNSPQIKTLDYTGPSLSYYITMFKSSEIV